MGGIECSARVAVALWITQTQTGNSVIAVIAVIAHMHGHEENRSSVVGTIEATNACRMSVILVLAIWIHELILKKRIK